MPTEIANLNTVLSALTGPARVGVGTWALAGVGQGDTSYGAVSQPQAIDTIAAGLNAGCRFIDTAGPYGGGAGEIAVGKALLNQDHRDRVIVATKTGMDTAFQPIWHRGVSALSAELSSSLSRLAMESVDLLQLHSPPVDIFRSEPGLGDWLTGLKETGTSRWIGLSARSPQDAMSLLNVYPFDAVQVNFNMLDERAKTCGLFDLCKANGVAVIARTPLCFGFLALKITAETTFGDHDHRKNWPKERLKEWEASAKAVQKAVESTDTSSVPDGISGPVWRALQYCLSFDAVSVVLPGPMTPHEATANALAGSSPSLPQAALDAVAAFNDRREREIDSFV